MAGLRQGKIQWAGWIAVVVLLLVTARIVEAHAVLKQSSPAANSTVKGPDVPITLRYNVRVDASRSKLQLLQPDNSTSDLPIEKQTEPDSMSATAKGLTSGAYRIRWQVLAPDGHITRGEIPFFVNGA